MNTEEADRKTSLRNTLDQDALLYDKARPGYPDALFKDIIAFSNIPERGIILEIGCGTAQATLPFARRGYSIHCIELGASLAAIAERNLAPYPKVQVSVGNFEDYPLQETSFDLVISATAFHWIDPDVAYRKVAQVLRPEGAIALFWNKPVQTQLGGNFAQTVQGVYRRIVPEMAERFPGLAHPDLVPTPVKDEIDRSGFFGDVTVLKYYWHAEYTSKAYTELLSTYSDHLDLPEKVRTRLYDGIERLIETEYGGHIIKEYLSILYLAHRKQ
jgi:SAM-dependent methyltransferase